MIQKVLKVGSSAAVTLPKKALRELGLSIGDDISLTIDPAHKQVVMEQAIPIDHEMIAWTKRFIERYRPALKALAK